MRNAFAGMLALVVTGASMVGGCSPAPTTWEGDPALYGVKLEVVDQREWTQRSDFTDRVRTVIERASARWNIDPHQLSGWRVRFMAAGPTGIHCGSNPSAHIDGCTDEDSRTITVSVDSWYCVEETPLAHEVGHVALMQAEGGDPEHHDARWWDDAAWSQLWDEMAETLPSPDGSVAKCFTKGSYGMVERWTGLGN